MEYNSRQENIFPDSKTTPVTLKRSLHCFTTKSGRRSRLRLLIRKHQEDKYQFIVTDHLSEKILMSLYFPSSDACRNKANEFKQLANLQKHFVRMSLPGVGIFFIVFDSRGNPMANSQLLLCGKTLESVISLLRKDIPNTVTEYTLDNEEPINQVVNRCRSEI